MKPPSVKSSRVQYFPIQKHWRKLGPLFRSKESKSIWLPNMHELMRQRASEHGFKYKRHKDRESCPAEFDGCDWRCDHVGRAPAYWDFACHAACHWVVDMCLYVARLAYPRVPWRIVNSDKHSTVWNGCSKTPVLFDINFLALKVSPREAWLMAAKGDVLKVGEWLHPWNIPKKLQP